MISGAARFRRRVAFALAGALLGVLVLHPITMAIYWLEFRQDLAALGTGLWHFLAGRVWLSFTPAMLPMSGLFAALGAGAGLAFAGIQQALSAGERAAENLREELVRDLPLVIAGGETERVEFKASLRWDYKARSVNRSLELVGLKAIAGFLNGNGGNLILGLDDAGVPAGLEMDFGTLKRPDRDGYHQFLMGAVKKRLGGDLSPLVHAAFVSLKEKDVCRVVIEPSHRPVYVEEGGAASFYLRMGNTTRRLDAREAVDYVSRRWPKHSNHRGRPRWLPRAVGR